MSATRILELASMIATSTAAVNDYLTSQNLPSPSFDVDIPPRLVLEAKIAEHRQAILEATSELHALMQGPIEIITGLSGQHNSLISLQAIYRFEIAKRFPGGTEGTTFQKISEACGLSESDTRRLLRHAMTNHIFRESSDGTVTHTAASKLLSSSPLLHDWVGMVTEELWPAATRTVDALVRWPGSQEPSHAGFNIAHNTDKPCFLELSHHPERMRRFGGAMKLFGTAEGYEPVHLVENYPWAAIGTGTVVDVGGSLGIFGIAIVEKFPALNCIIQDQPEVIAEAKVPSGLEDRVSFMAHDFFSVQPVKDADVYLFRWIFHDWSDEYATRILKALIPALKNNARIVVHEYVLPKPGVFPNHREKVLRGMDMAMLEQSNSRERDVSDWARLFQDADSRYQISQVIQPPGSNLGIIEARWNPTITQLLDRASAKQTGDDSSRI